jgi:hypothetical protein
VVACPDLELVEVVVEVEFLAQGLVLILSMIAEIIQILCMLEACVFLGEDVEVCLLVSA